MVRPLRAALLQDRKCGLGMPEEHPGRPHWRSVMNRFCGWFTGWDRLVVTLCSRRAGRVGALWAVFRVRFVMVRRARRVEWGPVCGGRGELGRVCVDRSVPRHA